MKKISTKLWIAAAAIASSFLISRNASAQDVTDVKASRLGVAMGIGVPTKSYEGDVVLAPDLRYQLDLGQRTSLTLTTGYYGFIGKDDSPQINADLIPLKAGAKFFFGNTFYVQPEVGVSFATKKDYGTPFTWAPSVGVAGNRWEGALRYEEFDYDGRTDGMVALRVAYAFHIKKH